VIDLSNYKEWMDAMRDKMDSMGRKKFENSLILRPDASLSKTNEFSR